MKEPTTQNLFYLRSTRERKPIGAVAVRYSPQEDLFVVAASVCSKNDEWNRLTARNKAEGKLDSSDQDDNYWFSETEAPITLSVVLSVLGLDSPAAKRGVNWVSAEKIFAKQLKHIRAESEKTFKQATPAEALTA